MKWLTLAALPLLAAALPSQLTFSDYSDIPSLVQDGTTPFTTVSLAEFPSHRVRVKKTEGLCDDTVNQYSGYLDIDTGDSLFFWFFESRSKPASDPLLLWLNGGPGCSSSTGLLFELGPCSIANEGKNVTWNNWSWTEKANTIFLDQPVNVGYSYGDRNVNASPVAAKDVYAFLQLFYAKFPQFKEAEFTVSGESYAGTYIPAIASEIHHQNKAILAAEAHGIAPEAFIIPLKSLAIGNGLTDALHQFPEFPNYACPPSEFAIFDEETCNSIRSKVPTCERLTNLCYSSPSRFTCVPATLSCWQIVGPIQQSGRNPYDVRKKCDREGEDGPLCYKQMEWIETYLNQPSVKKTLGVPSKVEFKSCNMAINQAFTFNGDVAHNTAALIPELLEDGIKILIYAGEDDALCNYVGNLAWMEALEWSGQKDFNKAKFANYTVPTVRGKKNVVSGSFKSVGKGAGTFTFLRIKDAGHMVPYDQPEASLDMISRWLDDKSFA